MTEATQTTGDHHQQQPWTLDTLSQVMMDHISAQTETNQQFRETMTEIKTELKTSMASIDDKFTELFNWLKKGSASCADEIENSNLLVSHQENRESIFLETETLDARKCNHEVEWVKQATVNEAILQNELTAETGDETELIASMDSIAIPQVRVSFLESRAGDSLVGVYGMNLVVADRNLDIERVKNHLLADFHYGFNTGVGIVQYNEHYCVLEALKVAGTIQKSTSITTLLCACQLFDLMLLKVTRVKHRNIQRRIPKSWKFKYKFKKQCGFSVTGLLAIHLGVVDQTVQAEMAVVESLGDEFAKRYQSLLLDTTMLQWIKYIPSSFRCELLYVEELGVFSCGSSITLIDRFCLHKRRRQQHHGAESSCNTEVLDTSGNIEEKQSWTMVDGKPEYDQIIQGFDAQKMNKLKMRILWLYSRLFIILWEDAEDASIIRQKMLSCSKKGLKKHVAWNGGIWIVQSYATEYPVLHYVIGKTFHASEIEIRLGAERSDDTMIVHETNAVLISVQQHMNSSTVEKRIGFAVWPCWRKNPLQHNDFLDWFWLRDFMLLPLHIQVKTELHIERVVVLLRQRVCFDYCMETIDTKQLRLLMTGKCLHWILNLGKTVTNRAQLLLKVQIYGLSVQHYLYETAAQRRHITYHGLFHVNKTSDKVIFLTEVSSRTTYHVLEPEAITLDVEPYKSQCSVKSNQLEGKLGLRRGGIDMIMGWWWMLERVII